MKQMVCEICESTAFRKEADAYVCQGCGMQYTPEAAKKLIIETEGEPVMAASAAPAASDELENLYQLARRAREDQNGENAAKYYEMILLKVPMDWEAAFFSIYYRAKACTYGQIEAAANSVGNCLGNVIALIRDQVKEDKERTKAVFTVVTYSVLIAEMMETAAKSFYADIDSNIKMRYTQEMLNRVCAARNVAYTCGDKVEEIFGKDKDLMTLACEAWLAGVKIHKSVLRHFENEVGNQAVIDSYLDKVAKYDEAFAQKRKAEIEEEQKEKKRREARIKRKNIKAEIAENQQIIDNAKTKMGFNPNGLPWLIMAGLAIIFGIGMKTAVPAVIGIFLVVIVFGVCFRGPGKVEEEKFKVKRAQERIDQLTAELEKLGKE